jgi:hypothetical protein
MKKLFFVVFVVLVFGLLSAQEETVVYEEPAEEAEVQEEEADVQEEEAETEYEAIKEKAEVAMKELDSEIEPEVEEEAPEEEPERTFSKKEPKVVSKESSHIAEFKPAQKEITKKWSFMPINISLGTSFQVGFTVAQMTHKNFEIRIGNMMLGPGFRFGSKVEDDAGFVPGLTFLGEVSFGKFFGNPLKENCFGIMIGIGSKIVFDIRNMENKEWEDGIYADDTLYADFLPIYFTYRWHKDDRFYDVSLRVPLVWQNGVYVLTDETKLYNGVPDLTLNFSFIF